MCGGRGTRFGGATEKPLVPIRGRAMVDRVIDAATDASRIETVHAVVSPHASKTRAHLADRRPDVRIVDAPGDGYVSDLQYAVDAVGAAGSAPAHLTLAADLPLLDAEAVDAVVEAARVADGASLTVCVPAERKRELGVSADTATELDGREVVPAGINVVGGAGDGADGGSDGDGSDGGSDGDEADDDGTDGDGSDGDDGEESAVYLTDDARLAVNVNYPSDALIAERLLATDASPDQ